jgi:ABC-2 type transport system permease protein
MIGRQPGQAGASGATTATGPGGSIYDLGYQGYEGPRLGRQSAAVALFWNTLRACFGIGRGGRAKIAPFVLAALALLPAVIAVGIAALAAQAGAGSQLDQASPVRYDSYHGIVSVLLILFCGAQAPELFGRDQRYSVLPLYFSRILARTDYAIAKLGGLVLALFLVDIAPQVVLFAGRVFVASDPITGISDEIGAVPRFLAQGVLTAGLLGGVSGLIAAYTPRRAYATAAIIAVFIVSPIIIALVDNLATSDLARFIIFLSAPDVLAGTNAAIFEAFSDNPVVASLDLPRWTYMLAAAIGIVGSIGLTIRRYLRIPA